jgi:UDP-N-acetylmuramoyl-L-alanyl-D-glutamate--2,6-diaminopimelate ligase
MTIKNLKHYESVLGDLLPELRACDEFENLVVRDLRLDSREISNGAVFVALSGQRVNGEHYIESAIQAGAVAVFKQLPVDSEERFSVELVSGVPVVSVANLLERLSEIAASFFDHPSQKVQLVGITGTNGKSTCVTLLERAWNALNLQAGSIGTLGFGPIDGAYVETGMTTPDAITVQRILANLSDSGCEKVAMEVSSHGISLGRASAAVFEQAVITNISHDHLDFHGSFEAYVESKLSFVREPRALAPVINWDDEQLQVFVKSLPERKFIRVSLRDRNVEVYPLDVSFSLRGLTARIVTPWGSGVLRSPLLGEFNLSNLLQVLAVLCSQGASLTQALSVLAKIDGAKGRMERVLVKSTSVSALPSVFVDYAHTPDGLEKALDVLKAHSTGRVSVVFGCGGDRDKDKRELMGRIAASLADAIIVTTDNPRTEAPENIAKDILRGIPADASVERIDDRAEAIRYAVEKAAPNDVVLIAGKGHETYQLVADKVLEFSDFQAANQALYARIDADRKAVSS